MVAPTRRLTTTTPVPLTTTEPAPTLPARCPGARSAGVPPFLRLQTTVPITTSKTEPARLQFD